MPACLTMAGRCANKSEKATRVSFYVSASGLRLSKISACNHSTFDRLACLKQAEKEGSTIRVDSQQKKRDSMSYHG